MRPASTAELECSVDIGGGEGHGPDAVAVSQDVLRDRGVRAETGSHQEPDRALLEQVRDPIARPQIRDRCTQRTRSRSPTGASVRLPWRSLPRAPSGRSRSAIRLPAVRRRVLEDDPFW